MDHFGGQSPRACTLVCSMRRVGWNAWTLRELVYCDTVAKRLKGEPCILMARSQTLPGLGQLQDGVVFQNTQDHKRLYKGRELFCCCCFKATYKLIPVMVATDYQLDEPLAMAGRKFLNWISWGGRLIPTVGDSSPYTGVLSKQKGEHGMSTSVRLAVLPDCGCRVSNCLELLMPPLHHPRYTVSSDCEPKETLSSLSCFCHAGTWKVINIVTNSQFLERPPHSPQILLSFFLWKSYRQRLDQDQLLFFLTWKKKSMKSSQGSLWKHLIHATQIPRQLSLYRVPWMWLPDKEECQEKGSPMTSPLYCAVHLLPSGGHTGSNFKVWD